MNTYKDLHGKPVKEGIYVSNNQNYFRIIHHKQAGWFVTSNLNPELTDALTPRLAKQLTPLLAGDFEVQELRRKASWLEEQLEKSRE